MRRASVVYVDIVRCGAERREADDEERVMRSVRAAIGVLAIVVAVAAGRSVGAEDSLGTISGRLFAYEGVKCISEETYSFFPDGTMRGTWKSFEARAEPPIATEIATRNGLIVRGSMRIGESILAISPVKGKLLLRWSGPVREATRTVLEPRPDGSVAPRAALAQESISAPSGAYFIDSLLWHPYLFVLRELSPKQREARTFPAIEPRKVVGPLSLVVTPKGSEVLRINERPRQARRYVIDIFSGKTRIDGGIDLWLTPEGRLLKGSWGLVEVVPEEVVLEKKALEARAKLAEKAPPPKAATGKFGLPLSLAATESVSRDRAKTYTVAPGDTFSSIARKLWHGKSSRWQALYEANKERLELSSPSALMPGMVLFVPEIE